MARAIGGYGHEASRTGQDIRPTGVRAISEMLGPLQGPLFTRTGQHTMPPSASSEASEPRRDGAEHRDDESRRDGAFADEDICRSAPDRWRGPETVLLRQPALRGAPPAPGRAASACPCCWRASEAAGAATTGCVRWDTAM